MGTLAVGSAISMSGILLAQMEESNDGLKLTKEQGSWFGNNFYINWIVLLHIQNIQPVITFQ